MTLEKGRTDPRSSSPLREAEEILRLDLIAAQTAYTSATPEEKPLARLNYLRALGRFAGLVLEYKIPDDLPRD